MLVFFRCIPQLSQIAGHSSSFVRHETLSVYEKLPLGMRLYSAAVATHGVIFAFVYRQYVSLHVFLLRLSCLLVSFGLAVLWLLLLQLCGGVFVWAVVAFAIIASWASTYQAWQYYAYLPEGAEESSSYLFGLALLLTLLSIGLVFLAIYFRRHIKLAIGLVKEASAYFYRLPGVIVVPFVQMVLLLLIIGWALIFSAGNNAQHSQTEVVNGNSTMAFVHQSSYVPYVSGFNVFMFFWAWNFVVAIAQCVVAMAVHMKYFEKTDAEVTWPV